MYTLADRLPDLATDPPDDKPDDDNDDYLYECYRDNQMMDEIDAAEREKEE